MSCSSLLPLDTFVDCPAAIMTPTEGRPAIALEFPRLLDAAKGRVVEIEDVERHHFYRRNAENCAVVHTGETRW
jgi:L-fucose mutarotase/ribose pyranase (RbsD/FucU family)